MSSNQKTIKIVSWNVNGLRALVRKGDFEAMMGMDADIYCLQETKVEIEQLEEAGAKMKNDFVKPGGYTSCINASQERKGHAGTALYTRLTAQEISTGFSDKDTKNLDQQGRIITARFDGFMLINCYFPNGGSNTSSLEYKLEFYEAFLSYINNLRSNGEKLIIAGDWNIAHTEIDIARPKENANHIGFLPIERAWLDRFEKENWIDVWRHFNPDTRDVYTWWDMKTRARDRNVGWRIDYIFVDKPLLENVSRIEILGDVCGSDHCPMVMEIQI